MKRKVVICKCGGELYLSWSAHCTGSFKYVDKDFNGIIDCGIEIGNGGIQGSPYEWKAICNSCGNEYKDLSELEEIEVEIEQED